MLSNREKRALEQKIQSNRHEIYVISFDQMDAIIKSSPKGQEPHIKEAWEKIRGPAGIGANYASSADDAVTMAKLIGDLGAFTTKVYIKNYGGKPHIILKGHPGLRSILTGTKYGITNPKVVTMGLGKASAVGIARQGGMLTIVLLSAYRIADYALTDEATLTQLIGTLATDVVKVGIVVGASILTASLVGVTAFAVGPIAVVIATGLLVSGGLDYADTRFGLTNRIIAGLDELESSASSYLSNKRNQAVRATRDAATEFVIESAKKVAIKWVRKSLREYLAPYSAAR